MTPPPLYLLDTNILVHFVRGDAVWTRVRDRYQFLAADPKPLLSVVTEGELRSLAFQHGWWKLKLDQMEFALGYFDVVFIDSRPLVDAYAVIDSYFQARGQPFDKN